VQVDARRVRDLLQQQDRLVVLRMQARVLAVAVLLERVHALAQGPAPELDVRREVVGLAVEDEGAEAAAVAHGGSLVPIWWAGRLFPGTGGGALVRIAQRHHAEAVPG